MLHWDFRYVVESERRRADKDVTRAQYGSVVQGDDRYWHRRRRFNPWVCLAVMAAALYILERVVFG